MRRALALLGLAAVLAGCAIGRPDSISGTSPPVLGPLEGIEWKGTLRGPLGGLGPQVDFHVFLRGDGEVWAEIRYDPDDGPPLHEVLLWNDASATLFDRRLRSTDLSDEPGRIDAFGEAFSVVDAAWLLTGCLVEGATDAWSLRDGEWRGRSAARGWRRDAGDPVSWTELVWREGEAIRTLRARVVEHATDARLPRVLRIDGPGFEAPVVFDAATVRFHAALGDTIFDPLWSPAAE